MTEFGSLALVDEGTGDGDGVKLSLPGVRRGERISVAMIVNSIRREESLDAEIFFCAFLVTELD